MLHITAQSVPVDTPNKGWPIGFLGYTAPHSLDVYDYVMCRQTFCGIRHLYASGGPDTLITDTLTVTKSWSTWSK